MLNSKHWLALGVAAMVALGATSQSMAAPAVPNAAIAKAASSADTINVRWGGWGWRGGWGGWGWGPGLGVGIGLGLAATALAGPYYGYDYAAPAYGYAAPAYVPTYGWRWRHRWHRYAHAGWRWRHWRRGPAYAYVPAHSWRSRHWHRW